MWLQKIWVNFFLTKPYSVMRVIIVPQPHLVNRINREFVRLTLNGRFREWVKSHRPLLISLLLLDIGKTRLVRRTITKEGGFQIPPLTKCNPFLLSDSRTHSTKWGTGVSNSLVGIDWDESEVTHQYSSWSVVMLPIVDLSCEENVTRSREWNWPLLDFGNWTPEGVKKRSVYGFPMSL